MVGALKSLFGWSSGGAPHVLAAREGRVVLTASGLAIVALLPPLVSLGVPRALASLGPPRAGIVLVSALLLAPALVGLACALRGLDRVVAGFAAQPDAEHRRTILRVFATAAAFAYALAVTAPTASGGAALPTVAALALLAAWLFLLHTIVAPVAPPLRRHLAMTADIGFLSGFLCAGGEVAAGWYPLYLAIAIDSGLRLGFASLVAAGVVCAGAFALVVVATPFWQQHLPLSVGLGVALVGLPGLLVRAIRGVAAARQTTRSEGEAKNRLLAALGDELGAALDPVRGLAASVARLPLSAEQRGLVAALQRGAGDLLQEVDELRSLAAHEPGEPSPPVETFDLHAVINDAVAMLRLEAAEKGLFLALRVDPHLPWLLRGSPAQLRRVLTGLVGSAIKRTESGKVRVGFDALGSGAERVGIRITVRDQGGAAGGLGLAVLRELVALMGGRMSIESAPPKPGLVAVELGFAPAAVAAAPSPDLRQRPVLIASDDAEFARQLAARLQVWGGDAAWIGGFEAALAHLQQPIEPRPVVILDGRGEVLQALTLADRAASLFPERPPYLLFVAEAAWLDSLASLADGELAAILPMPLSDRLLANALHALPVDGDAAVIAPAAPGPERARPGAAQRPPKILVAEDNAANRVVTERVLSLAGYQVQLAANGEEALAALEADGIDLVLMDIGMPRINGYEAARLYCMMRSRPPIIALTGDASPETERLCREAGMDGVLTKPIAPERLIAAVEAALGAAAPGKAASVVTPIASHPRFAGDNPAPVDERAVEQLRSLGAGSSFFRDVVEAFRSDALDILDAIARAAADCDAGAFREGVHALRSCAANVGGTRLCELLQSMQEPTARDLRQQGSQLVQRLGTELAKLDAALLDYLAETEKSRR